MHQDGGAFEFSVSQILQRLVGIPQIISRGVRLCRARLATETTCRSSPKYRRENWVYRTSGKKALLFEKRSKNFGSLACALKQPYRSVIKSFLVLFFKKEPLC
jgi:hypothetical protein